MKWQYLIIVFAVIALLAIATIKIVRVMAENQAEKIIAAFEYDEIDMQKVADGTYVGEASTDLIRVKVSVKVVDYAIREIKILKHGNGRSRKAEIIINDMVEQNTYDVDAVTGATHSSELIKHAVYQALYKKPL